MMKSGHCKTELDRCVKLSVSVPNRLNTEIDSLLDNRVTKSFFLTKLVESTFKSAGTKEQREKLLRQLFGNDDDCDDNGLEGPIKLTT
jgi:hypothetical protein